MNGTTELVFILDRSGSMYGLESDTIGGFNAVLEKQKKAEGKVLLSTVLFNQETAILHDRRDIREIPALTAEDYSVSGCTALYDAVGGAIRHIRNIHRYIRPEDVPDHTLFVITTDGLENASREYKQSRVREMIRHQRDKYSWEFLFLGANIDTVEVAEDMGISASHAVSYRASSRGISDMYCFLGAFMDDPRPTGSWTRKKDALMKEGQDEGKDTPSPASPKALKRYPRAFD